jgi:hypothetical protein
LKWKDEGRPENNEFFWISTINLWILSR